jgi:hypothetical protein
MDEPRHLSIGEQASQPEFRQPDAQHAPVCVQQLLFVGASHHCLLVTTAISDRSAGLRLFRYILVIGQLIY